MTAPDANAADWALMLRVLSEHLEGGIAEFAADDLRDAGFVGPERVAAIEAERDEIHDRWADEVQRAKRLRARLERVETENARLRAQIAAVEALADEWDRVEVVDYLEAADRWDNAPEQLRRALEANP